MKVQPISDEGEGTSPGESFVRRTIQFPAMAGGVTLWSADLSRVSDELSLDTAWLSRAEHARAERFGTPRLKATYVAGRSFLRWVLGAALSLAPAALSIHEGVRGRPHLEGPRTVDFNVSHTRSRAVVALLHDTTDRFRIGVDIERFDRDADFDRIARRVLSLDEQASMFRLSPEQKRARFLRYWTCKEALAKATGDGLIAPFAKLTIDVADGPPRLVSGPPPYLPDACQLHSTAVGDEYLVALALWTRPQRMD